MKFVLLSTFTLFITQVIAKPAPGCLQNYTIVATDTCSSVAARFNLAEIDFYTMNPGLHHNPTHDCDNLDDGRPFCVCMKPPCVSDM
ncbi:hypothetical protein K501DRAFT_198655 [Backusella circina FSU 941]|nr:hypothetical protein K501DRAFT_198655 [Backusella circina FSU 941]